MKQRWLKLFWPGHWNHGVAVHWAGQECGCGRMESQPGVLFGIWEIQIKNEEWMHPLHCSSSSDVGLCHYSRRYWLPTFWDPEKHDNLEHAQGSVKGWRSSPVTSPPPWALSCPWLPISQRANHPAVPATVYSAWRKLSRQYLSFLANRVLFF